jgi:Mg-chelatase subunit ChlD
LIAYDNRATLLTPFLRNTEQNKAELKKAIKYVQGRGGTDTTQGIEHGLWMIKNRKNKNPVTCMFLLSDGVDNHGS